MRLLFDQNLPPRLVDSLSEFFPDSIHVMNLRLDQASDREIREYASQNDYTIVTKDADFGDLNLLFGFPPKVVWIRRGNCSAREVENLLRENHDSISALDDEPETGLLMIF